MSAKSDNARLRIGRYRTNVEKGQDVERPFVYVPEGFDLERAGALGDVLKAAGVSKRLGQDAPSMVFRVPKQGPHVLKLEEAAAVRKVHGVRRVGQPEPVEQVTASRGEPVASQPKPAHLSLFSSAPLWRGEPKSKDDKSVRKKQVVLLSNDDYERERALTSAKEEGDGLCDDGTMTTHFDDGDGDETAQTMEFETSSFVSVDDMYLKTRRAALRGRVKRLMRSVSQCCERSHAVMIFDNARRDNPQLDLFTDSGRAVLLGTYESKDLVAWAAQEKTETEKKSVTIKERTKCVIDTDDDDIVTQLPKNYDKKDEKDDVREVPHKNVTHALFFSSDRQRRQFDDLLAGAVSEGVLLVGGTPHSFRKARQALRAGKPIFVFDQTGGAATLFAAMFKAHREREVLKPIIKVEKQIEQLDEALREGDKNSARTTLSERRKKLKKELERLKAAKTKHESANPSSKNLKIDQPWSGPNQQEAVCIAQNWHVYFADARRVDVSNLPDGMDSDRLKKFFADSGHEVKEVHPSSDLGGVCVVTFADNKAATDACTKMNKMEFHGQKLKVTKSAPRTACHNWMAWKVEDDAKRSKDPVNAVLEAIATESAWPSAANDEAVCVIKPDQDPDVLTDELTRIMYTVEDKSEVRGTKAEADLIMDAWCQWSVFMANASSHRLNAYMLYVPIVLLTFVAVVLATWETKLKLRGERRHFRQNLRYTIMVLPFLAALFIAMNNKWQPMIKWARLKLAARSVEREIYKFRMRVGEYAPRRHSHSKAFRAVDTLQSPEDDAPLLASQPIKSPRECFSDNLKGIWDTVQESEVVRGALDAPKVKENELVEKIKRVHTEKGVTALINNRETDLEDVEIGSDEYKAGLVKPLMAQEYLERRVYPKLSERLKKAPPYSSLLAVLQAGILLCTFAAGICGAFDAPELVPAVLALSAAISAWIQFGLYPQWLRTTNGTIAELKNIDIWWHGLTFIQQRQAHYTEVLVARTEDALTLEIGYISQLAIKLDKKMGDDPEDGGNEKKSQASSVAAK